MVPFGFGIYTGFGSRPATWLNASPREISSPADPRRLENEDFPTSSSLPRPPYFEREFDSAHGVYDVSVSCRVCEPYYATGNGPRLNGLHETASG